MTNIPRFVDLQGFKLNETFIVKEAAILVDGCASSHFLFRPPIHWSRLTGEERAGIRWLTNNHHSLRWMDGNVSYDRARELIREATCANLGNRVIYVKGSEKIQWLRTILGDNNGGLVIENIDEAYDNIGSLERVHLESPIRCAYHARNCALSNVWKLHQCWRERQTN